MYNIENETTYGYYRLEISKNGGENLTQMAELAVGFRRRSRYRFD